jgi:DNA-binding helix-hairpin-helix protein with protein kinase domain
MTLRHCDGTPLRLRDVVELGSGSAGLVIASAEYADACFKIYVTPTRDLARRIHGMMRTLNGTIEPHPTASPAWPRGSLCDETGALRGIVLPRATGVSAHALFSPQRRVDVLDEPTWATNLELAARVADLFGRVHGRGFVVGDVSPANLLVDRLGRVALIDCDSMQFIDPSTGERFPALNLTPEYCSPEGLRSPDRWLTPEHDQFGLTLLVWQLLLDGDHPYEGVPLAGPDEGTAGNIVSGACRPFRPDTLAPVAGAAARLFPDELLDLAHATFVAGHTAPSRRTSAAAWTAALRRVGQTLAPCWHSSYHVYPVELGYCPWCARVLDGLPDSYPGPSTPSTRHTNGRGRSDPRAGAA